MMENQQKKRMKLDIAFELANEICLGTLMVSFAASQTRTAFGLEALFEIESDFLNDFRIL